MIRAVFLDCFGVLYQSPAAPEPGDKLVLGMRRNQELLDFGQSLRPRRQLGVISNCRLGLFEEFFSDNERAQLFDTVIISSEVGLDKPQPEIFYLACQRVGVQPGEAVFIDDTSIHCNSAVGIGMHVVLYRSNQQAMAEVRALLKE